MKDHKDRDYTDLQDNGKKPHEKGQWDHDCECGCDDCAKSKAECACGCEDCNCDCQPKGHCCE